MAVKERLDSSMSRETETTAKRFTLFACVNFASNDRYGSEGFWRKRKLFVVPSEKFRLIVAGISPGAFTAKFRSVGISRAYSTYGTQAPNTED